MSDPRADRRGPPRRLHAQRGRRPLALRGASAAAARCRSTTDEPADAAVRLEIDRWNGSVSPRLVLRQAQPVPPAARSTSSASRRRSRDGPVARAGPRPGRWATAREPARGVRPAAALRAGPADALAATCAAPGIAGLLGDLVASGEPVLAVTAHAPHRARALAPRVGGFALTSWAALEDDPGLAAPFPHVVVDRPAAAPAARTIRPGRAGPTWPGARLN